MIIIERMQQGMAAGAYVVGVLLALAVAAAFIGGLSYLTYLAVASWPDTDGEADAEEPELTEADEAPAPIHRTPRPPEPGRR